MNGNNSKISISKRRRLRSSQMLMQRKQKNSKNHSDSNISIMHHSAEKNNSLPILSGVFPTILLISTITSTKIIDIGSFTLDG